MRTKENSIVKNSSALRNAKGITLVALIITIVILLILAGVSIGTLQNTGLFEKTKKAKVAHMAAECQEQISLDIASIRIDPANKDKNVDIALLKDQLPGEDTKVSISSLNTTELTGVYKYDDNNSFIFKIDSDFNVTVDNEHVVKQGSFKATVDSSSITTKSATVTADPSSIKGGVTEYTYIFSAGSSSKTYTGIETASYTPDDLYADTDYTAYVLAKDSSGNTYMSNTVSIKTQGLSKPLTTSTISVSSLTWSNETASVTVSTTTSTPSGYSLQYQVGGYAEGSWQAGNTSFTLSGLALNTEVFVRFTDGTNTNHSDYVTITIIDGTKPTVESVKASNVTEHSIPITVSAKDNESGLSGEYTYEIDENGTSVASGNSTSSTYTFTGLKQFTKYTVKVTVKDNAGNSSETSSTELYTTGANAPVLKTGMTPVKFVDNKIQTTTSDDANWFDYSTKSWANAQTEDGSLWVWIPRYAYKVHTASTYHTSTSGTFDIQFLSGTTNTYVDTDGTLKSNGIETTWTASKGAMSNYVVHPVFQNESSINYKNGGWSSELSGFWVAKFEAGYASGGNSAPVKASTVNYTQTTAWVARVELNSSGENTSTTQDTTGKARNWLDGVYGSTTTSIKYPTFQGSTYSMNYINHNDAYNICRAMTNGGNIYGFSSSDSDSHLMKNSEWGAVAYLGQSKYGLNGTDIAINSHNSNNSPTSVYAVTGYDNSGNTWNNGGADASTTGTIYGVYDMSGGVWERTAAYIDNGHAYLKDYGASIAYNGDTLKTTSTKYTTVYPYSSSDGSNGSANEATARANYNASTSIYGDGVYETSSAGYRSPGWYGDYSGFPAGYRPFFIRGGVFWDGTGAGLFYFGWYAGYSNYAGGFRVCVV